MKRSSKLLATVVLLLMGAVQIGCRACGSPYDYSSPVANCQCDSCGCNSVGRSGSASPAMSYAGPDKAPENISSIAAKPGETTTR